MPLLITTSRRPSRRTRTLAKELNRVIPGSMKINRGKLNLSKLREYMIRKGLNKLLIIETRKGNPSILQFLSLSKKKFTRNLIFKINSLIMQIDKNQKIYFTHTSGIKADGIDQVLLNVFQYFFSGVELISEEIRKGFIEIKYKDDQIVIGFTDQKGKRVYPLIRGNVISYEKM